MGRFPSEPERPVNSERIADWDETRRFRITRRNRDPEDVWLDLDWRDSCFGNESECRQLCASCVVSMEATVGASGTGQRSPERFILVISGVSPGPKMRSVRRGRSAVRRATKTSNTVSIGWLGLPLQWTIAKLVGTAYAGMREAAFALWCECG
jgi:hypothetical protein